MTRILHVEDNDDNVYMLKMRFGLLDGFEIIVAADGELGRTGLGWRAGKAGGAKSLRDAIAGRHRALDRIPN